MHQELSKEQRQDIPNGFGSVEVSNDCGKILVERPEPKPD